jgi:hypothetical protein
MGIAALQADVGRVLPNQDVRLFDSAPISL